MTKKLDTSYHDRRLARRLAEDPEFREEWQQRWIETMPVLAAIFKGEPRCCCGQDCGGSVVRQTEWGTLYLCGENDYYTLCKG